MRQSSVPTINDRYLYVIERILRDIPQFNLVQSVGKQEYALLDAHDGVHIVLEWNLSVV